MPALLIRHKVKDFDDWIDVFLQDADTRRANGAQAEFLYRNSADPNEVWLLLHWDDLFRASLFVKSEELQDGLARSGVLDNPDFWRLEGTNPPLDLGHRSAQ